MLSVRVSALCRNISYFDSLQFSNIQLEEGSLVLSGEQRLHLSGGGGGGGGDGWDGWDGGPGLREEISRWSTPALWLGWGRGLGLQTSMKWSCKGGIRVTQPDWWRAWGQPRELCCDTWDWPWPCPPPSLPLLLLAAWLAAWRWVFFLLFILLFWNQILICLSVRLRFRASSHLRRNNQFMLGQAGPDYRNCLQSNHLESFHCHPQCY